MIKKKPLIKSGFYNIRKKKIKKGCCTNVAQQQIRAKKYLARSLI
nr:MAG TPA: hypothetical protein [Caudoviricetes sp.]